MVKDEAVAQDLHFAAGNGTAAAGGGGDDVFGNPTGFDPMEEDNQIVEMGEKDLWLDRDQENHLLDVNDASIFYNDFPPLPDFPCMSSSSSSSSLPAASNPLAATSSSSSAASSSPAVSWAMMKSSDAEDTRLMGFHQGEDMNKLDQPAALSSTASMEIPPPSDQDGGLVDVDCIDVMENFGYIDLIDTNEIWDPSSVFQSENPQEYLEDQQQVGLSCCFAACGKAKTPMDGSLQKMQCPGENESSGARLLASYRETVSSL
ncbi:hypothetical protein DH2020_001169 [Rehmannia glutinosa]|uniref:Uncharacterized protein n=1 Tax=Rehmannia glutinosa TaxID=99300 RepID=A0ABR0XYJ9_REHGL